MLEHSSPPLCYSAESFLFAVLTAVEYSVTVYIQVKAMGRDLRILTRSVLSWCILSTSTANVYGIVFEQNDSEMNIGFVHQFLLHLEIWATCNCNAL